MVTIVFETHATTFDNENGVASGHYDAELSPVGISQAKQLGQRYRNVHLDTVFCSDLQRSCRTAEIAFAGRRLPLVVDSRLRECDYGDLAQCSKAEVAKRFAEHIHKPFPNGESIAQTSERMKRFLQDLLTDHDDQKVIVIGHRATQYGLEHWIKGLSFEEVTAAPWQWRPGWTYQLEALPS